MKHGFVKVALNSPELTLGAPKSNVAIIKKLLTSSNKKGVEINVFGQMALTGSTLGSMAGYDKLLDSTENAVRDLIAFSKGISSVIVIGLPLIVNKKVYDGAAVIFGGNNYGIALNSDNQVNTKINYAGCECTAATDLIFDIESLGISFGICFGEDFDKISPVSEKFALDGTELIVNISAGKALIDSFELRQKKLEILSKRLMCAYAYVSTGVGESVAKNVFCGDKIAAEDGYIVCASEGDNTNVLYAELDCDAIKKSRRLHLSQVNPCYSSISIPSKNLGADITREVDNLPFVPASREFDRIFDIMGRGVYSRMKDMKVDRIIFGLSGGLDSTMVLIACERMFRKYKLDMKNILAITMSGHGSGDRSKNNAVNLIKLLGVTHIDIPIVNAVDSHLADIGHMGTNDEVFQNAQARERAQILLDLSNKYNALMLGTGDLSESALGYTTFGGDQLAQYNPNSSLTKTLIRAIMRNYCLRSASHDVARIINDVLAMPISPELTKNQDSEKILGPYELHDFFLYNLIGKGFSVEKTIYLCTHAFPDVPDSKVIECLKTFVQRFFANQFKRNIGCDGTQVTEFDLSDKIVFSEYCDSEFLEDIEKLKLLTNK